MTALASAVSATDLLLTVDAGLAYDDIEYPMFYEIEDEVVTVVGGAHKLRWSVYRAEAGTDAEAHDAGTTLTRFYPDAPASAGGGTNTYDGV